MDFDTISSYLTEYAEIKWIVLGSILLIIEVMTGTAWILFVSLGALTLGGLMSFDVIYPDTFLEEVTWLFGLTVSWGIALWRPLRGGFKTAASYNNLIGNTAVVADHLLKKGRRGKVKWSGTIMNARLAPDYTAEDIKSGQEVWIHDVDGNVLIVSPFPKSIKIN